MTHDSDSQSFTRRGRWPYRLGYGRRRRRRQGRQRQGRRRRQLAGKGGGGKGGVCNGGGGGVGVPRVRAMQTVAVRGRLGACGPAASCEGPTSWPGPAWLALGRRGDRRGTRAQGRVGAEGGGVLGLGPASGAMKRRCDQRKGSPSPDAGDSCPAGRNRAMGGAAPKGDLREPAPNFEGRPGTEQPPKAGVEGGTGLDRGARRRRGGGRGRRAA